MKFLQISIAINRWNFAYNPWCFFYLILITVCICRIRKAKPIISHTYILNQKGLGKLSEFNWICQQNCCKLSSLIFCFEYFTSKLWKFPPQKMQIIKILKNPWNWFHAFFWPGLFTYFGPLWRIVDREMSIRIRLVCIHEF